MGRIMRRIGTGSATQRVELGGTTATQATDVAYDNTTSELNADDVQEAIDEVNAKLNGKLTLVANTPGSSYDLDISKYDALYIELRYYGTAFSTMTYRFIQQGIYRIYGFVDATTNFASASVTVNSSKHITEIALPNVVGSATSVYIYGVKY